MGRTNGPDNPAGYGVRGWGPVPPDKAEQSETVLEATGEVNVELEAPDWAETLVRGLGVVTRRK